MAIPAAKTRAESGCVVGEAERAACELHTIELGFDYFAWLCAQIEHEEKNLAYYQTALALLQQQIEQSQWRRQVLMETAAGVARKLGVEW